MESMACRSLFDRISGQSEVAWRDWVGFRNTNKALARNAWGHGYAPEALAAVVVVARDLGVQRLYSFCSPNHPASIHVLEKMWLGAWGPLSWICRFSKSRFRTAKDCLRYASRQRAQLPPRTWHRRWPRQNEVARQRKLRV